jgi:hypothetical protein
MRAAAWGYGGFRSSIRDFFKNEFRDYGSVHFQYRIGSVAQFCLEHYARPRQRLDLLHRTLKKPLRNFDLIFGGLANFVRLKAIDHQADERRSLNHEHQDLDVMVSHCQSPAEH